jgi:glycosyltransferase involved in cell wall biosynthesis
MFILLIQFYPNANPCYRALASSLRAHGHTVWVGTREKGNLEWVGEAGTIGIVPGPLHLDALEASRARFSGVARRVEFFKFILRIRRFVTDHRPDIVQVNPATLYWIWLLPLLMPRVIHFVLDFRQLGQRPESDLLASLRDGWANWQKAACCKHVYDSACFMHRLGAERILDAGWSQWASVVPVGVDDSFITCSYPRREVSKNTYSVRFAYVGVISRIRQLETLLEAARQVLQVTDKFQLLLIGTDATQGYYRQKLQELCLNSVVHIKTPVEYPRIPEVLAENDVGLAFVPDRPPDWHYYPTLKALEYRALGLPILASDNAPNREVVENGVNGLLVENHPEGLARGMLSFIQDRDFLEKCTERALLMRQGLPWTEVARMYEGTYEAILERDGSKPGPGSGEAERAVGTLV